MNIDFLYETAHAERETFGDKFCGPEILPHMQGVKVAFYEVAAESGGQSCEVYCEAWPARFYTIKVLQGVDSFGQTMSAFSVGTGSGQQSLVVAMAEAISSGMLTFEPEP